MAVICVQGLFTFCCLVLLLVRYLGFIAEGNTYRCCATSSSPLGGNTDVVLANIINNHIDFGTISYAHDTSILHHVFLLLFIMFLSIIMLFGVILVHFSHNLQGTHQEGEFRQLEIGTWKSYVRPPHRHNSKQAETSRRFLWII